MAPATATPAPLTELHAPYELTQEQISCYQSNGFIRLKDVLNPETLAHFAKSIQEEVRAGPTP
jgi:hypothetical protein